MKLKKNKTKQREGSEDEKEKPLMADSIRDRTWKHLWGKRRSNGYEKDMHHLEIIHPHILILFV